MAKTIFNTPTTLSPDNGPQKNNPQTPRVSSLDIPDPSFGIQAVQSVITKSTNTLVGKLNNYPYIQRKNDALAGDTRGSAVSYPPDSVIHTIGTDYPGANVDDGLIRGGIVLATARAAQDVIRIGNFLKSTKGVIWVLKQQGLAMTNARPEIRTFNPLSMIAQASTGYLGFHYPRHSFNPYVEGTGQPLELATNTYSTARDYLGPQDAGGPGNDYTFAPFVAVPRSQPKLVDLGSELFLGDKRTTLTGLVSSLLAPVIPQNSIAGYGSPRDKAAGGTEIQTLSYLKNTSAPYGGFGIFNDGIHRAVNTQFKIDGSSIANSDGPVGNKLANAGANVQKAIDTAKNPLGAASSLLAGTIGSILGGGGANTSPIPNLDQLKTYRSLMYGQLGQEQSKYFSTMRATVQGPSQNYKDSPKNSSRPSSLTDYMIINRGFSDPGASSTHPDRTNIMPPSIGKEVTDNRLDLVPLIFYDIKNKLSLVFRAVLTAITDTPSPEWNEYNYIGNPQTYYMYKRTTREFSFTFKIYCDTEQELKWNWMKLNRFIGMTYPSYNRENRMVGPFLRLTVGDILMRTPGFISGLTITIDDNTPWELNLFADPNLARVPHMVECAVTYKVIGDYQLDAMTTPFVIQNKIGTANGLPEWKVAPPPTDASALTPVGLPPVSKPSIPSTLSPVSVPGVS